MTPDEVIGFVRRDRQTEDQDELDRQRNQQRRSHKTPRMITHLRGAPASRRRARGRDRRDLRILQDGQISSISTARSAAAGGRAAQMCNHPWRFVRSALLIALPIKLILVFSLSITADEAYYFIWGHFLSGGYYDHPPLIGWLLYLFQLLGAHPLSVRLPAVLLTPIVGCAIYAFLKREDAEKAALASCAFILSPISLWSVLIATDVPLLIF